MVEYRAITVGTLGNTIERNTFDAADDRAAMDHARDYLRNRVVEVWQGERKVGALTPQQAPVREASREHREK